MDEFVIKYDSNDSEKGFSIIDKIMESCIINKIKIISEGSFEVFENAITHHTYRSVTVRFYGTKLKNDEWEAHCLEYFVDNLKTA